MKVYTVGQVTRYLSNLVDQDYLLQRISIKGEISNCKYHSMGHIYFSLKDENSSMPCVMFRGDRGGLSFKLEDGQAVVITGTVRIYEKESKVNFYARKITLDGEGEGRLHILFEQLKQRLFDEGLFDFEHKKPIPAYPRRVGIVTASTGAAIQDICKVAHRRNPYVELILYPAKVQGEGAAETIARGIRVLDRMKLDTIIIGRGGGSIEDLWAFNEEVVARAIYEAETPIISGTGHETDNTIADYAADLRAPTPSAAAEQAIPDVMTTLRQLQEMRDTMARNLTARVQLLRSRLDGYRSRLEHKGPAGRLENQKLRLEQLSERLHREMKQKLEQTRRREEDASVRLHAGMKRRYETTLQRAALLAERLHGLSPTAKLVGGFGYVSREETAVQSVKELKKDDVIRITMHDGTAEARVETVNLKTSEE
ncbi:MAG: exodeoxyribonuclease VII large subunit [Eubacterium sp.]|nr:exodeoxyribonuclease VII large subunit [Eubacterium sp.]